MTTQTLWQLYSPPPVSKRIKSVGPALHCKFNGNVIYLFVYFYLDKLSCINVYCCLQTEKWVPNETSCVACFVSAYSPCLSSLLPQSKDIHVREIWIPWCLPLHTLWCNLESHCAQLKWHKWHFVLVSAGSTSCYLLFCFHSCSVVFRSKRNSHKVTAMLENLFNLSVHKYIEVFCP